MTPRFLTLVEVLQIHQDQLARYGGRAGVRDLGLLQSAAAVPKGGIAERYFHSDIFEMAAAYWFHLIGDHPFIDGNKRVGVVAALVFLDLNGVEMHLHDDQLVDAALSTAAGRMTKLEIAEFLRRGRRTRTTARRKPRSR